MSYDSTEKGVLVLHEYNVQGSLRSLITDQQGGVLLDVHNMTKATLRFTVCASIYRCSALVALFSSILRLHTAVCVTKLIQ